MSLAFDTLEYAEKLIKAGVDEKQAKAQAQALRDALTEDVATKHDIGSLRRDIGELKKDMDDRFEKITLQLTIRLGGLIIVALGSIAKLF